MTDPKRLLDGAGSEVERQLLMAGCDEPPDPLAKRRAAAALAIGAAASVWPVAAAAATAKASKAGVPFLVKLLAVGAVGAGAAGTAVYLEAKAPEPKPAVTVARQEAAPVQAPQQREPAQSSEQVTSIESLEVEAPAEAVKRSPQARSSAEASSIADEMRVLDEARRALAAGDASLSLRALDTHRRQFPRGAFSQEAVLLRIQALAAQGNHAAARTLAQRFRERHPNSPHLRRIESVLGEQ